MKDTNKKKIFKVGIYLRLSDEDKDKSNTLDDSESIKNQRYLLLEEIRKRDGFLLFDEYVDENLSGAGTYRPEFERLIKDCENGKLDVVLCKSQSRFSRDMEIIEKYLHNKFIEWNVRFISLSDYGDTENPSNKKARQINGLVNEWYLEDVSNNIRSAFRAKMINGEYISPFAPFGYDIDINDNNKLVVDRNASEIVEKIYILYLKGLGYGSIVKYLNNNNIPSPSYYKYLKGIKLNIVSNKPRNKIKWNITAVKSILTNEVYLGHLVQGKRTTISYKNHKIKNKSKKDWIKVLNTHDAIISEDMFYKVQKLIQERTRICKNTGSTHIFSGKVFCLVCGNIMKKKNSSKHEYLVCSSSQYNLCNNKTSIRYDALEEIILKKLNKLIDEFFDKKKLINSFKNDNYINNKINYLKKQICDNKNKIDEINFYLKNLYEDKVNGIIDISQYINLVNNYKKNINNYKYFIKVFNKEIIILKNNEKNIINNVFYSYKDFEKLNSILVSEFIEQILIGKLVNKTRQIKIKWNI